MGFEPTTYYLEGSRSNQTELLPRIATAAQTFDGGGSLSIRYPIFALAAHRYNNLRTESAGTRYAARRASLVGGWTQSATRYRASAA
jgi:hypothetical protein